MSALQRHLLVAWFVSSLLLWLACVCAFAIGNGTVDMLEFDSRSVFRHLKVQICRDCTVQDAQDPCFCETANNETRKRLECVITTGLNAGTMATKECIRHYPVRAADEITSISRLVSDSTWAVGYFTVAVTLNAVAWYLYQEHASQVVQGSWKMVLRVCSLVGVVSAIVVVLIPMSLPDTVVIHTVAFVAWVGVLTAWSTTYALAYRLKAVDPLVIDYTDDAMFFSWVDLRAMGTCICIIALAVGHLMHDTLPLFFIATQFIFLLVHTVTGFMLISDSESLTDSSGAGLSSVRVMYTKTPTQTDPCVPPAGLHQSAHRACK